MKKGQLTWVGALLLMIYVIAAVILITGLMQGAEADEQKPWPTPMPPVQPWEAHDRGLPWGTVHGLHVNFREGPGTEYKALFQLSTGCAVEVVGEYHGWYQVLRAGVQKPVWVCSDHLEIIDY